MVKYTLTFEREEEGRFQNVLDRLDPDEYKIVEEVKLLAPDDPRYSLRQAVIEMDPEACLTFRLGMKNIKIRRERTEEELAVEEEINSRNTIKVTVQVPMGGPPTTP
jgi:hypothetical protein